MKIHSKLSILLASLVSVTSLQAQNLPNTVKPQDRELLKQQATDFYNIIDPIAAKVSPYVVVIKSNNKVIAMGTVTELGIVTKLSEINRKGVVPRIIDHEGNTHQIVLKSSNEEYDLALLENPSNIPSLKLKALKQPKLGTIILAAGAADQALSSGVVSVIPRSLKEADRGFLGVVMDMEKNDIGGVMLMRVEDQTAASRAGLQAGDIITKVNDNVVNNMIQMRNLLQQKQPGDVVTMSYIRDEQLISDVKVTLGARKEMPGVRRSRMNFMKRMGGKVNSVGEGFPEVLQSDIQIKSHYCGAPIIDLDGNFIGVALARSSRIKTYIIETKKLAEIFKK